MTKTPARKVSVAGKATAKTPPKVKAATRAKAPAKAKVPTKAKVPVKAKVPIEVKVPAKVKAPIIPKAAATARTPTKAKTAAKATALAAKKTGPAPKTPPPRKQAVQTLSAVVTLRAGMYLIRLLRKAEGGGLRQVSFRPRAKAKGGKVFFFEGPGVTKQSLTRAGQCLIVRVDGEPAQVNIARVVDTPAALDRFTLRFDRIDDSGALHREDERGAAVAEAPRQADPAPATTPASSLMPIELAGDFATVGSRMAPPGQWLGSTTENHALEGITVRWPGKPDGVDLFIAAQASLIGELPEVGVDQLTGVRGLGLPLTGIGFRLDGPLAKSYVLQAEAAFSNGSLARSNPGQQAQLASPGGAEPLTALRISIWPTG